jgi:uncharacterized damage-inducible protein DinB
LERLRRRAPFPRQTNESTSALLHLRTLTRYSAWANSQLYATVTELPEVELTKKREIVFGNMLRTLNHVYTMDLVWRAHLTGTSHGFTTRVPDARQSLAELRIAQVALDDWYIRYAEGLSNRSREEIVDFTFIGGGAGAMSRADILLHVVNHTTYHRGHIVAMIYQVPAEPPITDFPVFLRDTR